MNTEDKYIKCECYTHSLEEIVNKMDSQIRIQNDLNEPK